VGVGFDPEIREKDRRAQLQRMGAGARMARKFEAAKEPRRPGDGGNGTSGTAVITRTRTQTKKPSMYRVLLLNDECGVFTYEGAETKVTQVMDFARKHQHPLQCIMEKK
jgi:ATP-dependent Clp protease adaptor protein ClpS